MDSYNRALIDFGLGLAGSDPGQNLGQRLAGAAGQGLASYDQGQEEEQRRQQGLDLLRYIDTAPGISDQQRGLAEQLAQRDPDAAYKLIADWMAPGEGFTLKPGESRFQGGQKVAEVAPEPAKSEIRSAGNAVISVAPDGTVTKLYEAPQAAPQQTELARNLIMAGIMPGSPEFQRIVMQNAVKPAFGTAAAPSGYAYADPNNPSAGLAPIPGGPADPSNPRNFDDSQRRAASYAARGKAAIDQLEQLENSGYRAGARATAGKVAGRVGDMLGVGPEVQGLVSSDIDNAYNASLTEFFTSKLRRESGATIRPDEFANEARQYQPQATDSPEVVKQKQEARRRAIEAFSKESGGAYGSMYGAPPPEAAKRQKYDADGNRL